MSLLETNIKSMEELNVENKGPIEKNEIGKQIASAILIVGLIIAGAILLKDSKPRVATKKYVPQQEAINIKPVDSTDMVLGDKKAKVTLIMYEDFQCPWCGKFENESEQAIRNSYVKNGEVQLVYRDFPFLGPESYKSAEASMCANDQGKFWEYHDYLFSHQSGENKGAFADGNLKTFAKILGLNETTFNTCLDSGKYTQAVAEDKAEGTSIGVRGTPKGFILRDGEVVDTIDGYLKLEDVLRKIDGALE